MFFVLPVRVQTHLPFREFSDRTSVIIITCMRDSAVQCCKAFPIPIRSPKPIERWIPKCARLITLLRSLKGQAPSPPRQWSRVHGGQHITCLHFTCFIRFTFCPTCCLVHRSNGATDKRARDSSKYADWCKDVPSDWHQNCIFILHSQSPKPP